MLMIRICQIWRPEQLGLRDEKITNTQLSAERIEAISGRTWTLLSPLTGHWHWGSLGRGARGDNSGVGVSTFLNDWLGWSPCTTSQCSALTLQRRRGWSSWPEKCKKVLQIACDCSNVGSTSDILTWHLDIKERLIYNKTSGSVFSVS